MTEFITQSFISSDGELLCTDRIYAIGGYTKAKLVSDSLRDLGFDFVCLQPNLQCHEKLFKMVAFNHDESESYFTEKV